MNKLSKSFEALDAAADELLKKSNSDDDKEDIKPDDVAKDSDSSSDDSKNDDDVKKGGDCGGNCSPDGDNLKKSDSDDKGDSDDDSDDDDGDSDDDDMSKSLESFQRDVSEDFKSDEDISKGIDNSEFQAALVTSIVKSLGEIQYDFHNRVKAENAVNDILAKSLQAVISSNTTLRTENDKLTRRINKLEKSLEKGFATILDAIDSMSTQPAHMRKSVGSINVLDKDFNKSVNGNGTNSLSNLSKGEILGILNSELYSGNTLVQPGDIISYESGAPLRPELHQLVLSKAK